MWISHTDLISPFAEMSSHLVFLFVLWLVLYSIPNRGVNKKVKAVGIFWSCFPCPESDCSSLSCETLAPLLLTLSHMGIYCEKKERWLECILTLAKEGTMIATLKRGTWAQTWDTENEYPQRTSYFQVGFGEFLMLANLWKNRCSGPGIGFMNTAVNEYVSESECSTSW